MDSASHPLKRLPGFGLLIACATLVGAALRFATAPNFDFYGDELWTLKWAQESVGEILSNFGSQGLTMHLYILGIKVWGQLVGFSPVWIKMPSLLAGIALIPLVFWLGRKWLDPYSAALAAIMTAINLQMIIHSRTARVYIILTVGVLLSMALFVRALETKSKRDLLVLSVVNASLLALSVQSLYILAVQSLCLGLEMLSPRRPKLRELFGFGASIGLSLGLAALFYYRTWSGVGELAEASGVTNAAKRTYSLWVPYQKLWFPFTANHMIVPWIMLSLLVIGSWIAWRRHPSTGRFLILWALLPSLIFFLQRSSLPGGSIARYVLPALPAQFLLIALGGLVCLRWLMRGAREKWPLGVAIVLFSFATFIQYGYKKSLVLQQEPTQRAIQRIQGFIKPGDLVTSFPEQYYGLAKSHFGDAAVKLPDLVRDPSIAAEGSLILLTAVPARATRFWKPYLEAERVSGPGYRQHLQLLTTRRIPPGRDALRPHIEQFYIGLLRAVAQGKKLHKRPVSHYKLVSRIHRRMAYLADQAGNRQEARQHRRLMKKPRAWNGDMKKYPAVLKRLEPARTRQ